MPVPTRVCHTARPPERTLCMATTAFKTGTATTQSPIAGKNAVMSEMTMVRIMTTLT